MSAYKRQLVCKAQGAGHQVDATPGQVTACICLQRSQAKSRLKQVVDVCQLKQGAEHHGALQS
jgi:hypothetical protein